MVDYTLSSYEEALKTYDQNVENLKYTSSNEIENLTEVFHRTQKDVENDPFLSLSEKSRMLKKRQEGFDKLKKEKEKKLEMDVNSEVKNKEDFLAQDWWFHYHCFKTLSEISKLKEVELCEVSKELEKKQEELARLQAELEAKQKEADDLKLDLNTIQTGTLHETFFQLDVMPRIKKVESALKVLEGQNEYNLSKDFVNRTIRCLTKECKKQNGELNYEWWKLELSFDTVENWIKWEDLEVKGKLISILTDGGFVVTKMEAIKPDLSELNVTLSKTSLMPRFNRKWENEFGNMPLYVRERLLILDKDDIQWRIDIFKQLSFSFANEPAFIKQVEMARSEWVNLIEDIDKWLNQYVNKLWNIELRTSDDKKQYFKIPLDCNQRNARILMEMGQNGVMRILCVAPHVDYDNILRWQTKNYFQTWKWNWTKRWKQWRKTWRA